jgi:hypothetical protein
MLARECVGRWKLDEDYLVDTKRVKDSPRVEEQHEAAGDVKPCDDAAVGWRRRSDFGGWW